MVRFHLWFFVLFALPPRSKAVGFPIARTRQLPSALGNGGAEEEVLVRDGMVDHDKIPTTLDQQMQNWKETALSRLGTMNCSRLANKSASSWKEGGCSRPHAPTDNGFFLTRVPAFYISLGGDEQREWISNFSRLSREIHVVEGVRGDDSAGVVRYATGPYQEGWEPKLVNRSGVFGCTLSHLIAIKAAYDSGVDLAMILESDAVPDLAPWWPQSLEQYIEGLPEGWQASQLAWVTEPEQAGRKYWAPEGEHSIVEPSWGTQAYLVHRRGMERIMKAMWDKDEGKFDMKVLLTGCPWPSADGCLMSFSPDPRIPSHILDSDAIYQAVPPRFTSYVRGSDIAPEGRPEWFTASYCDDIVSSLDYDQLACGKA